MKGKFKLPKEFLERLAREVQEDDYEEPGIMACSPEIYQEMLDAQNAFLEKKTAEDIEQQLLESVKGLSKPEDYNNG